MGWPRSPLHAPGRPSYLSDGKSERDDSDGVVEDNLWTPGSYRFIPATTARVVAKPSFEPSYVYDESETARMLSVERRATRVRNCVCCGLAVFAAVFVLACLGVVLSGSPAARAHAMSVLHRIEESPMVQFTITPKPHVVIEKYGKRREETTDFNGFKLIHGQLFPVYDRSASRRLSFDGWIYVETNASTSYDINLYDHRGYRVMRSAPLTQRRSRCATFDDVPPLHDLLSVGERAFEAQDWSSFRMNCSHPNQTPVEVFFAHMPFVFCPSDVVSTPFSPISNTSASQAQSQTMWIHGERMLIEMVLIQNKHEAIQARIERARLENLEMWGNATSSSRLIDRCPYLEAPLASYTPRTSRMLDHLLGNGSLARLHRATDSSFHEPARP